MKKTNLTEGTLCQVRDGVNNAVRRATLDLEGLGALTASLARCLRAFLDEHQARAKKSDQRPRACRCLVCLDARQALNEYNQVFDPQMQITGEEEPRP